VDQANERFGREIVIALQKYAGENMEFFRRCKRAAILYDWISGRKLEEIEAEYSTTPFRGRVEYGDIRRFADTTRFHLQSAASILAVLLLGKNPQVEIDNVLKQLEIGIPANALELLRLPLTLTRGEYLALVSNGILNPAQVWAVPRNRLITILGNALTEQLETLRPKAAAEVASI
jgi:ATP-dependent DNA helicase